MNKALNEFEKIVDCAKQERCPGVNVAQRVMYRIESVQSRYDRPMVLVATWSTLAAVLIALLSSYSVYSASETLSPIFALASTMTP